MNSLSAGTWSHRAVWLGLSLAALLLSFLSTYAEMARIWWTSSTFNHCLLIVPISAYLIWLKREQVQLQRPGVSRLALVYVLLNSLLWLVGALLSVSFFQHLAVVGMLIGVVWALVGTPVFRVLLFPLLYLYFGVPEGEGLRPYLMDWTAKVLVTLLRLSDVPVYLEGRHLTIPSGRFVVAEACSGINYLIATLAVGTMFAYLRYRSPWRRAVFMLLTIVFPLAANGIRAYGIVMIAHLSDHKYAVGIDHIIYGWLFFGIVILVLFSIGNLFSDADEHAPREPAHFGAARPGSAMVTTCLCLALAWTGPGVLALTETGGSAPGQIALPSVASWEGPITIPSVLDGTYHAASQRLAGRYTDNRGEPVVVEVAYYARQAQGAELISQSNTVFAEKNGWLQADHGVRRIQTGGRDVKVRELLLRDSAGYLLVWYWYDVQGHTSISDVGAKLIEAKARFAQHPYGSASIAIATRAGSDRTAAAARLEQFLDSAALGLPNMHAVP